MAISPAGPALDRRLLRDDVYRRLCDAIVTGRLAPGAQLRDAELAASLGVSRTPVREALLRLAGAGLVIAQPGRSTTVSELDPHHVDGARDVVAAMHELAVRASVGRLSDADIEAMRAANERFAAAIEDGDVDAAVAADEALHAVIIARAGNPALAAVLEQYSPVVRRAERLRFSSTDGRASVARHARLIDLCAAGDTAHASELAFDTWHTLTTDEPHTQP